MNFKFTIKLFVIDLFYISVILKGCNKTDIYTIKYKNFPNDCGPHVDLLITPYLIDM